jgi:hypothetical protein
VLDPLKPDVPVPSDTLLKCPSGPDPIEDRLPFAGKDDSEGDKADCCRLLKSPEKNFLDWDFVDLIVSVWLSIEISD